MPRINVEDKWWSDPRRGRLIAKIGSSVLADGIMLNLWRISQEFNGEAFDWTPYFEAEHIEAVSSIGLASLEHHLLYVKGSKEHHEWVKKKRDAARAGGLKSAKLREAPLEHQSSISQPSSSSSCSTSKTKEGNRSAEASPPTLLTILEKYKTKYSESFAAAQYEKCREYHWAKSGKEPDPRKVVGWFSTKWCQQAWEESQPREDPLIAYLQQVTGQTGLPPNG